MRLPGSRRPQDADDAWVPPPVDDWRRFRHRLDIAWPFMMIGAIAVGAGILAAVAGIVILVSHDGPNWRGALRAAAVMIAIGLAIWGAGSRWSSGDFDWRTLLTMLGSVFGALLIGAGGWITLTAVLGASIALAGGGTLVLLAIGLSLVALGYGMIKLSRRLIC